MKILEYLVATIVVVFYIAAGLAFYALFFGAPTMLLWNWLMPSLFHLPVINFWQAFGLYVLCGFLFKNNDTKSTS